jgi:GNAT superfamily N-acetyltransferase
MQNGISHLEGSPALLVESAWCAAWASLVVAPGVQVIDTASCLRIFAPHTADLTLNAVLRFRHDGPVTRDVIEEVLHPYRAALCPTQWWICLDLLPMGLRRQLHTIGMQPWSDATGMMLDLTRWRPILPLTPHIVTRRVRTHSEALIALDIICEVYGLIHETMRYWSSDNPNFQMYLAWYDETPVAAMAMQMQPDLATASYFHVATLSRWRRQGAAYAMMMQGLQDALQQGARHAVLTATPMAESLYKRLGFENAGHFEFWMPTAAYHLALSEAVTKS